MNYNKQALQIKEKLLQAKAKDLEFKTFGSSSHRYEVFQTFDPQEITLFEQKYNITLPKCYNTFLTQVTSRGAGPYYGMDPLGDNLNVLQNSPEKYLQQDCILFTEEWNWETWDDKVEAWEDKYDFDTIFDKLFAGTLILGTSGCTGYFGIVLNGENKGRVFSLSTDLICPHLVYEDNFLDWYEHWLDDVISGRAIKGKETFGRRTPNEKPFDTLLVEKDETKINTLLTDIEGLEHITKAEGEQLISLYSTSKIHAIKESALRTLAIFDYELIKPILKKILSHFDHEMYGEAIYIINYQLKAYKQEWVDIISPRLQQSIDVSLFRTILYILTDTTYDFTTAVLPFCKHPNKEIRSIAFYSLGQIKNKNEALIITLKKGLETEKDENLLRVIQAIDDQINDDSFLPYYTKLLQSENTKNSISYIFFNITRLLADLGKDAFTLEVRNEIKLFIDKADKSVLDILFLLEKQNQIDLLIHATKHSENSIANYAKALVFIYQMKTLKLSKFKSWQNSNPFISDHFDSLGSVLLHRYENSPLPYFKINFLYLINIGNLQTLFSQKVFDLLANGMKEELKSLKFSEFNLKRKLKETILYLNNH